MKKAPWNDYAGNEIFEGDIIEHPNGESGKIVFRPVTDGSENQWLVDYGGGILSRLCLQIGERGQAVRAQHRVEPTFDSVVILPAKKHTRKAYRPA